MIRAPCLVQVTLCEWLIMLIMACWWGNLQQYEHSHCVNDTNDTTVYLSLFASSVEILYLFSTCVCAKKWSWVRFFVGASGDIFKVFQVIRKTKATKQNEGMVLTSEPRQFKKLTMQKKTPCSLDAVQFHQRLHQFFGKSSEIFALTSSVCFSINLSNVFWIKICLKRKKEQNSQ